MSTIIMTKCWLLKDMNASQKAVLISLADNANDDGVCWPSIQYISERTCLSPRSVQGAIKWLIKSGIVKATERSGRSTIYKITPAEYAPPQNIPPAKSAPTPANNVKTPAKSAPTPADAAPITVSNRNRTANEPLIKKITPKTLMGYEVDEQIAIEFLELRKQKRAKLTPIALAGIQREADKAGITLNDAMRTCIERGWQSFKAEWLRKDVPRTSRQDRYAEDAAQINRLARWADEQILSGNVNAQLPEALK